MRQLAKRVLILILCLSVWLPVSIAAPGAMSLAMFGKAGEATRMMTKGCEQHEQQAASNIPSGECYNCSLCRFACTTLISDSLSSDSFVPDWIAPEFAMSGLRLHIPDRLQRPPLARAA